MAAVCAHMLLWLSQQCMSQHVHEDLRQLAGCITLLALLGCCWCVCIRSAVQRSSGSKATAMRPAPVSSSSKAQVPQEAVGRRGTWLAAAAAAAVGQAECRSAMALWKG
jgi:hypothetical protein